MAFPSSPYNGQTIVLNGITYTYDATNYVWNKVSVFLDPVSISNAYAEANAAYALAAGAYTQANNAIGTIIFPTGDYGTTSNPSPLGEFLGNTLIKFDCSQPYSLSANGTQLVDLGTLP